MFFQLATQLDNPLVTITQSTVKVNAVAMPELSPNVFELELDDSNVLPLVDSVLTVSSLPAVPALGIADGLFIPVNISLRDTLAYFKTRLHGAAFAALTTLKQVQSLMAASQLVNQLDFVGYLSTDYQLLQWPRTTSRCESPSIPNFPQEIRYATAELALSLASKSGSNSEILNSELDKLRVTSRRFSSVATTYGPALAPPNLGAGIVSLTAWNLLFPYLRDGSSVRLHRAS